MTEKVMKKRNSKFSAYNILQESGEWQARYESLRGQLGDLADLRAKYAALEAQMAAMAFVATVTTEEDKKRTQVRQRCEKVASDLRLGQGVTQDLETGGQN